jgi:hypothetical protein
MSKKDLEKIRKQLYNRLTSEQKKKMPEEAHKKGFYDVYDRCKGTSRR